MRVSKQLSLFLLATIPIVYYLLANYNQKMSAPQSTEDVASALLAQHGLQLRSLTVLQSLWAGYGEISHITAGSLPSTSNGKDLGGEQSYVIKVITPPPVKAGDEGHLRKILSYQVEQHFYTHFAPQMPPAVIPVAQCLASINEKHPGGSSTTAIILSDLRKTFPVAGEKRRFLSTAQVHASIDWLSSFHGFWWSRMKNVDRTTLVRPPLEENQRQTSRSGTETVWLNGGYTYLATRMSEYASLQSDADSEWREALVERTPENNMSIAESVATYLAPREDGQGPAADYQTLIHGDVKSENLFTSEAGDAVAFYDFQYTGLGLGVCDLAKLFTCSVPLHMLVSNHTRIAGELKMQPGEKLLLQRYLETLNHISGKTYEWDIFVRHWEVALVDWLRFQASWGFWGNTEWLEARVRWILKDEGWRNHLVNSTLIDAKFPTLSTNR